MSPARPRRIPLSAALPPLILLTTLIGLEVFLVQSLHEVWKTTMPRRFTRLLLLDLPPVLVTILLSLWILARLTGRPMAQALRDTGILHADRRQLLVAGIVILTFAGWHFWLVSLLDAEISITRNGSYVVWLAIHTALREELLYRGVALRILQRGRPWAVAAAWSALLFALSHSGRSLNLLFLTRTWTWDLALWQVIHPFFFGLLMARIAWRGGGSLWGPIAIHFGWYVGDIFPAAFTGTPERLALESWTRVIGVSVFLGLILLATEWMPRRTRRPGPRQEPHRVDMYKFGR